MEDEKCLVELDEILKYLDKQELEKIPYNIRKSINENKDKNYIWKYDESKELKNQNINRKTIAMLSYLNMEYLLNEEERSVIEGLHKINEEKIENIKKQKFKVDNIFEDRAKNLDRKQNEETQLVKVKNEKWYEKIFSFLRSFFRK